LPIGFALYQVDTVATPGDSMALMKCVPPYNIMLRNAGANSLQLYTANGSVDTIHNDFLADVGQSPGDPHKSGPQGLTFVVDRNDDRQHHARVRLRDRFETGNGAPI
jgi:hypothetical protein